jgi:cytochrome P450
LSRITDTSIDDPSLEAAFPAWPPDDETVRCPLDYFARLRESAPVYRYPIPSTDGVFTILVTGFAECASVLTRADAFVNDLSSVRPASDVDLEPAPRLDMPTFYELRNVFFADGEDHRVKRSWVLKLFERDRLESFRPLIEEEVDRLIDGFASRGRCNFRAQVSDVMPMRVVRRFIGLPASADPIVKRLSAGLAVIDNNPRATRQQLDAVATASSELLELCADLLEQRHEQPTGDYVSELVQTQVARDGALDPNALARHLTITIFGADHAMGGHLADVMARLGRHPELQQQLRADRSLVRQFALETLRTETPVPWMFRACVQDTTIGDVEVPAGSLVMVALIAGNHDPGEFADPATFDLSRPNLERSQLSLGRGSHRCAGAPMARLLVEVTVGRMLDRLLNIRLDEERSELLPELSFGFRIPTAVYLTFDPTVAG